MNKLFLLDCTITKDCNPVCSVHTDTEIQNIKVDNEWSYFPLRSDDA